MRTKEGDIKLSKKRSKGGIYKYTNISREDLTEEEMAKRAEELRAEKRKMLNFKVLDETIPIQDILWYWMQRRNMGHPESQPLTHINSTTLLYWKFRTYVLKTLGLDGFIHYHDFLDLIDKLKYEMFVVEVCGIPEVVVLLRSHVAKGKHFKGRKETHKYDILRYVGSPKCPVMKNPSLEVWATKRLIRNPYTNHIVLSELGLDSGLSSKCEWQEDS